MVKKKEDHLGACGLRTQCKHALILYRMHFESPIWDTKNDLFSLSCI